VAVSPLPASAAYAAGANINIRPKTINARAILDDLLFI
jgi:hypothetical protein